MIKAFTINKYLSKEFIKIVIITILIFFLFRFYNEFI